MARTAIPVQTLPKFGAALDDVSWTSGDATNDHEFVNTGKEILLHKNDDASQRTSTVVSVPDQFGRTGDENLAPAAGEISMAGPFDPDLWNQAGGLVHVDLTVDTSQEFAVVKFG